MNEQPPESITNTLDMDFNKIPAGTFRMGFPETEKDHKEWQCQHRVTITKAFYMQTTEVTQSQWTAVMGTEPWKGEDYVKEGPNYAATYVNWVDAVAYCKKLSKKEGKTYRLPTEAEWEYACRAGTETRWSFGDDEKELGDYAWHWCWRIRGTAVRSPAFHAPEQYAHQVGLKKANAFGLYDMHGNVWEWCHDYYEEDYYQQSPEKDPTGPVTGSSRAQMYPRVQRGGSWYDGPLPTRSADRSRSDGRHRGSLAGFRLVRELD